MNAIIHRLLERLTRQLSLPSKCAGEFAENARGFFSQDTGEKQAPNNLELVQKIS